MTDDIVDIHTGRPPAPVDSTAAYAAVDFLRVMDWATHTKLVRADVPTLGLRGGDVLYFDEKPGVRFRWVLLRQVDLDVKALEAAAVAGIIVPLVSKPSARGP